MNVLSVKTTKPKEVIDITENINNMLEETKAKDGVCNLFLLHTTAALVTADLDPGTDLDMLDAFDGMVPELEFRHPHDPNHVKDHIMSSVLGASLNIPVKEGKLFLGDWQRIVLIELSGPRDRRISLSFIKANQ